VVIWCSEVWSGGLIGFELSLFRTRRGVFLKARRAEPRSRRTRGRASARAAPHARRRTRGETRVAVAPSGRSERPDPARVPRIETREGVVFPRESLRHPVTECAVLGVRRASQATMAFETEDRYARARPHRSLPPPSCAADSGPRPSSRTSHTRSRDPPPPLVASARSPFGSLGSFSRLRDARFPKPPRAPPRPWTSWTQVGVLRAALL
jgi:hypothetical protein